MKTIPNKLKQGQVTTDLFRNEAGAIDLASIMVGVIVIGLIGGVIAATVFTVIPWAQDNAAKQQLDSIVSAESAYMGLSSDANSPLPAGYAVNSFGNSAQLAAGRLLSTGTTYCVVTPADGKSYSAYSESTSGKVWFITDKNTKPQPVAPTDPVPAECGFTAEGNSAVPETPAPYVDPTPTLTTLTYRCDTNRSGQIPLLTGLNGQIKWSDETSSVSYNNAASITSKTLLAGTTYKVTFDGTYQKFDSTTSNLKICLRSVDHWGANTGVTNASGAFISSTNLVSVPEQIPATITDTSAMFYGTTSFNQDINSWNVSNVQNMGAMFQGATQFNQPLDKWDVSNVTTMAHMFRGTINYNLPLSSWNTSSVTSMSSMFQDATRFNQNIKNWSVSKVTAKDYFRTNSALTTANSPF